MVQSLLMRSWWIEFWDAVTKGLVLGLLIAVLGSSSLPPGDRTERVRAFTRAIEFDYVGWTISALHLKVLEASLGTAGYLRNEDQHRLVLEYLDLIRQIERGEALITSIYADPAQSDPHRAAQPLREELERLYRQQKELQPLAESILQEQVSFVVARLGLALGGQPVPPVLYHSTPLPLALIVSPRNVIRQDENISLVPDLPLEQRIQLEEQVDRALNVSSLVVNIGGVGTYPTMVQQTSSFDWLCEVVAHEWVHNFLTLRPLGVNYMTSPELRVINETVASIAGKEIGRLVLETFYPELLPPPSSPAPPKPQEPPAFDFRKEMHLTRLEVDRLLAEGKVEEAEAYMEQRRQVFWQNGYRSLRKLNQAYFAFYGAYADEPGGAAGAGEDPVGAAVRRLRQLSPSLADFLNRISWVTSFEQLEQLLAEHAGPSNGLP